jgi:hypothetical protein
MIDRSRGAFNDADNADPQPIKRLFYKGEAASASLSWGEAKKEPGFFASL